MRLRSQTSSLAIYTVTVSAKTTWIFFALSDADGMTGYGEATLNRGRQGDQLIAAVPAAVAAADACPFGIEAKRRAIIASVDGVVGRAIASGVEQAWLDRESQRLGRPLAALLGGACRDAVACYANINRGTLSRAPAEFAERAAEAAAVGYGAIKLAPFDDVTPEAAGSAERAQLIEAGFDRVAAVMERVGDRVGVQVDCHSRFRLAEASDILARLADLGVTWFEEPVKETPDALAGLVAVRRLSAARGVHLAGAENVSGLAGLAPVCTAGCYDIVMPDIILSGGVSEVVRMGHLAAALGSAVSLHNPCGPIMDMHSLHVAIASPALHSLERQFDESPLYEDIISRSYAAVTDGIGRIGEHCGLGVALKRDHPAVHAQATYPIAV